MHLDGFVGVAISQIAMLVGSSETGPSYLLCSLVGGNSIMVSTSYIYALSGRGRNEEKK